MPITRSRRQPFDARHAFVATPPGGRPSISVAGREFAAGEEIDKSLVTPRRLRQMYEASRVIAVAPGSSVPETRVPRPRAIGPSDSGLPSDPAPEAGKKARPRRSVPRRRLSRAA